MELCDYRALLEYQLRDDPAAILKITCDICGQESQYDYPTLINITPENARPVALPENAIWALVLYELETADSMPERGFLGEQVLIEDIEYDQHNWAGCLVSESKLAPKLKQGSLMVGQVLNKHHICTGVFRNEEVIGIPLETPKGGLDIGTFFIPKTGHTSLLLPSNITCTNPSCGHIFGITYSQFVEVIRNQVYPSERQLGNDVTGHLVLKCEICQTSRIVDSKSFDGLYKL